MNRLRRMNIPCVVCLLFLTSLISADVKLPAIIGDNMMLQQKIGVPVWGWADPGENVTVSGSWGKEASTTAGKDGRWQVNLLTPSFGGPHSLSIQGNDKITINNVIIGEVWLCAGQSNMGWRLSSVDHGKEDAAKANYPNIRIFDSERAHHHEPKNDVISKWTECTPETAASCSAVSFYFAHKLHTDLNVPIGIVLQAYAGTPIEGWMPRDIQLEDPITSKEIAELDAESANYDLARAKKQLERATEAFKSGRRRGAPKLRQPANHGHQYPGNIFNGMIYPVRPFGIAGAIWYQGERNAKHTAQAVHYENQLPRLINYYRSSWHEMSNGQVADDFPFYFVQLPSWMAPQTEPVEANAPWAVSRDAMRRVAATMENTGTAVAVDTGDHYMLHPKNKRPIGSRLAYLALKQLYGKNLVEYGPFYKSYEVKGNRIVIRFDSVGSGLMTGKQGPLDSFAIAGEDGKFVWGDAVIKSDTIVVSAKGIQSPVAVRYAWAMNPSLRNLLYNKEGIPASPFRTDDWPLYDPTNYDPPTQDKPKAPEGYTPPVSDLPRMTQ